MTQLTKQSLEQLKQRAMDTVHYFEKNNIVSVGISCVLEDRRVILDLIARVEGMQKALEAYADEDMCLQAQVIGLPSAEDVLNKWGVR